MSLDVSMKSFREALQNATAPAVTAGRDLLFEDHPFKSFIDFCKRHTSGNVVFRGASDNPAAPDSPLEPAKLADSNVICSDRDDGLHIPMLDIDMPAMLLKSSTYGHYHLYIDKPMTWENYVKLLDVLAEVGILEPGYVGVSKRRGRTQLRTPWTKKEGRPASE